MVLLATDSPSTPTAPATVAPAIAPTGGPAYHLPVTGGPYQPVQVIQPSRPVVNVAPAPARPGERANVAPNLLAANVKAAAAKPAPTIPWWVWLGVAVAAILSARKGRR